MTLVQTFKFVHLVATTQLQTKTYIQLQMEIAARAVVNSFQIAQFVQLHQGRPFAQNVIMTYTQVLMELLVNHVHN